MAHIVVVFAGSIMDGLNEDLVYWCGMDPLNDELESKGLAKNHLPAGGVCEQ